MRRCLFAAVASTTFFVLAPARAQVGMRSDVPPAKPGGDLAFRSSLGPRVEAAPLFMFASNEERVAFGATVEGRYGLPVGPLVVAPGIRGAAYFTETYEAYGGLATARLTLPLGSFAPYAYGGAGPMVFSGGPNTGGAIGTVGAGALIHTSQRFSFGIDAAWTRLRDFTVFTTGPVFAFGI